MIPLSILQFTPAVMSPKGLVGINSRHGLCALYFVLQASVVLAVQGLTSTWSTTVGPNQHQIWPCARALARAGGHKLCVSICLTYVLVVAAGIQPLVKVERNIFLTIGVLTFVPTYSALGPTLEACSVWCWSAGAYSVYFVLRPYLHLIDLGHTNTITSTSSNTHNNSYSPVELSPCE